MSFSTQNHAESSRNFVKNSVLEPKHAKLDQKSETWAHMGPYGPGTRPWPSKSGKGPARALEEREKFRKTALFFLKHIFTKKKANVRQTALIHGFNVFLNFLAENGTKVWFLASGFGVLRLGEPSGRFRENPRGRPPVRGL